MTEQLHYVTYRTTSDEVWKRSGICAECNHPWPCDSSVAIDALLSQLREQREALMKIRDGSWNIGTGRTITVRKFASQTLAALAPDTEGGKEPRNFGEVLRELGAYDPDLGPAPDTEGKGT